MFPSFPLRSGLRSERLSAWLTIFRDQRTYVHSLQPTNAVLGLHSRIGSSVGRACGSKSVSRARKKYQTSVAAVLEWSRWPELRESVELEWSGGGRDGGALDAAGIESIGLTPQCDAALVGISEGADAGVVVEDPGAEAAVLLRLDALPP
jgi:hypothetical protein